MLNDLFNLKVGWILSRHMPVVSQRFDIDYPAELQKICVVQTKEHSKSKSTKRREDHHGHSVVLPCYNLQIFNSLVKSRYDETRGHEEVHREHSPQRPREECSVQKIDVERSLRQTTHGCCSSLLLIKVGGYVIL